MFRTEQHRLSRCDLARGWWPNVTGRTRTIPAYRRPDRYLGVWRPRPGSKRPPVAAADDRLHARQWLFTPLRQSQIANSPAVSGLLIGGPNEPPAGAADPSSIYRATDEHHELLFREVIAVSRTHGRWSNYLFLVLLYIDSPFAAVDGVRSSDYS
ncbi:hypothetical protein T05_863 [Trichinella murrelli]|uniref:Uncharacterized protein n=1 Tax=Trichinella murrelli TaxID=144512 RepID=A0A0V0U536_9BILA|nr:hypothetical protein T05_863 [Trichinella murrelli]